MNFENMPELIEPVLIQFNDTNWVHPEIEDLLEWEIDGTNPGKWSYNGLTRVYIENDKNQIARIVVQSKELKEGKTSMQDLQMLLETTLFEDVWMPGGDQFCFSKLGKMLSKTFSSETTKITFVSPDVGISNDDGEYSWSS